MTGRRLYDKYVDAMKKVQTMHWLKDPGALPIAWPYLTVRQRRQWDELARMIAPRRRKASS